MRLLYLSSMYPLPANNGARMRTCSILRALAAEGHSTTLVAFSGREDPGEYRSQLVSLCSEAHLIPRVVPSLMSPKGHLRRLSSLLVGRPYAVSRFRSTAMRTRIAEQLRQVPFDAVVSDSFYSLTNLPATGLPMLLDCPNVEHRILQRFVSIERNNATKLYAWLECRNLRRWEAVSLGRATLAIACSEEDRSALNALCSGLTIRVAPNTVPLALYEVPLSQTGGPPTILFTGGMDWHPNRDAVSFFLNEVWPLVRARAPEARFVAAGRKPTTELRRVCGRTAGVELTGTVADMRPLLANATVVVAPLRIGSGTKLKILEAAAMKRAIVSTTVGLEGLDFVDGKELLVADDPRRFARTVIALLEDAPRRRALGLAARRRVELHYSEPAMREAVRGALDELDRRSGR